MIVSTEKLFRWRQGWICLRLFYCGRTKVIPELLHFNNQRPFILRIIGPKQSALANQRDGGCSSTDIKNMECGNIKNNQWAIETTTPSLRGVSSMFHFGVHLLEA